MPSVEESYFIAAVYCADHGSVEKHIGNMSGTMLQQALTIALNQVRLAGDHLGIVELIKGEMTSRGISPKTKKSPR